MLNVMTDNISNNGDHPPSNSDEIQNKIYNPLKSFDELEISEDILRGIYSMGFEYPSSIQRIAIRPMLDSRDLIAQAQSGTGKTATFLIPALHKVDKSIHKPQVIILCPNRELAQQAFIQRARSNSLATLGEYKSNPSKLSI